MDEADNDDNACKRGEGLRSNIFIGYYFAPWHLALFCMDTASRPDLLGQLFSIRTSRKGNTLHACVNGHQPSQPSTVLATLLSNRTVIDCFERMPLCSLQVVDAATTLVEAATTLGDATALVSTTTATLVETATVLGSLEVLKAE